MLEKKRSARVWQPLNIKDTPAAAEYEVLAEGILEWLDWLLWRWAMDRAVRTPDLAFKAERLLKDWKWRRPSGRCFAWALAAGKEGHGCSVLRALRW
jgi:hypothetical protein